jgi:hypothetical protein
MKEFLAAHVAPENARLFKVEQPGWYAFDDDHVPLLGPFDSREECVSAIGQARRGSTTAKDHEAGARPDSVIAGRSSRGRRGHVCGVISIKRGLRQRALPPAVAIALRRFSESFWARALSPLRPAN